MSQVHALFYRFGLVTLSIVVLCIFAMVIRIAFTRQSGITGLDAGKIVEMRYEARQEALAKKQQQIENEES